MNPQEVLKGIEAFADASVVDELPGGPASDSYLVKRGTQRFVLRLDSTVAAALGLDRRVEAEILEYISRNGLGPRPEFAAPDRGILITRYIEGRAWSAADLHDAGKIHNLAMLLRRLHTLQPVGQPFNLRDRVASYARIIDTAEGRELADDTQRQLRELETRPSTCCLCHNDLISANIVEGRTLVLIDWEYAAIGNPMFDLATIAEHHHFNLDKADALISAYFGSLREEDVRRLSRYRSFYRRLLVLWLASVEQLCEIGAEQQIQLQQAWQRLNDTV